MTRIMRTNARIMRTFLVSDPILRIWISHEILAWSRLISSCIAQEYHRDIVASRACLNDSGVVHGRLVAQMPIEAADEAFLLAFRDQLAASRTTFLNPHEDHGHDSELS